MIDVPLRQLGVIALATLAAVAPALAQPADPVAAAAVENARLRDEIAAASGMLKHAQAEVALLHKSKAGLEAAMRRIGERAEVHVLGTEFTRAVMEQLRRLPAPEQVADAREQRRRALAKISDANLEVERRLAALDDGAARDTPAAEAPRPATDADLAAKLGEQRRLLERLHEIEEQLVKTLREAGQAELDLQRASDAARARLTRVLFWVPSPYARETVNALGPALAWTVSPANWRDAGAVLVDEGSRRPFLPAIAVLLAAALVALRGRLLRALGALAPDTAGQGRYSVTDSLTAVGVTLALALPGPLLLWTCGRLLAAAPDAHRFALALGDALQPLARMLLVILLFARLFDVRGVAVRHFGWDAQWVTFAGRALRRLALVAVPVMLVAALNGLEDAPFEYRESLGRLAFSLGMLVFAAFLVHVFRRDSPLIRRLRERAPRSWPVELHAVWFAAAVAIPLGLAILAAAGYFIAAGFFFGRILESLFFLLGAMMLYGLSAEWVMHRRARLAGEGAAGAHAEAPRGTPALDLDAIGEQTRSLLDVFATLLFLGGLWWLWRDALSALSVIGDYALWTYNETVNGKEVTHPLTVSGLFLAIVVGVVTGVVVRNIGALLDLALLQRLNVQSDVTYAIKIVARYVVAGIGIALAAGILGVGWSDVQWLIAALGVGLGFGLGEIFSNLISGLIVLAERPIRIGDVVTVGDVSGTVSDIRARATAVTDFDNKEVLIPNKSFITDRLINWTLSNQITRLLIKFSVARESDMERVQRITLEAVMGIQDVLREPPPAVFVTGFGAKSLDFEIHAFVGSFEQRRRVQHEINAAVDHALRANGIPLA